MIARLPIMIALCLTCAVGLASAQNAALSDSELNLTVGHWVASGVSFQSGSTAHPFAIDVKRVGDKIQVTVPSELKLAGGQVYILARAGDRIFRHIDDAGRIVELSLASTTRATLLVTGSGGDGRITWQLEHKV